MKRMNQAGSHLIGIALLILVIGIIGFGGFKVMQANKHSKATATVTPTVTTASGTIRSTADLTQAANALDSSSGQVNSGLDDASLDNSLNDML